MKLRKMVQEPGGSSKNRWEAKTRTSTLNKKDNHATGHSNLGRGPKAMDLSEEMLEASKKALGSKHPGTLDAISDLAISFRKLEREQKAMKLRKIFGRPPRSIHPHMRDHERIIAVIGISVRTL